MFMMNTKELRHGFSMKPLNSELSLVSASETLNIVDMDEHDVGVHVLTSFLSSLHPPFKCPLSFHLHTLQA